MDNPMPLPTAVPMTEEILAGFEKQVPATFYVRTLEDNRAADVLYIYFPAVVAALRTALADLAALRERYDDLAYKVRTRGPE